MLSAVLGILVSLSTFLVIGATNSLTYNIVGHVKTVRSACALCCCCCWWWWWCGLLGCPIVVGHVRTVLGLSKPQPLHERSPACAGRAHTQGTCSHLQAGGWPCQCFRPCLCRRQANCSHMLQPYVGGPALVVRSQTDVGPATVQVIILSGGVVWFGDSMSYKRLGGICVAMLGIIW